MDRAQADLLIVELGDKLGVADLTPDASGAAGLSVDEGALLLRIAFDEATGGFDLSTPLAAVAASPSRLARALGANFCFQPAAGGTFGLDPAGNMLILQMHCPGAELDCERLVGALERLAAQAEAWTKVLGALKPETPAVEQTRQMPMGGGLRA
jgi:hypothetical protein